MVIHDPAGTALFLSTQTLSSPWTQGPQTFLAFLDAPIPSLSHSHSPFPFRPLTSWPFPQFMLLSLLFTLCTSPCDLISLRLSLCAGDSSSFGVFICCPPCIFLLHGSSNQHVQNELTTFHSKSPPTCWCHQHLPVTPVFSLDSSPFFTVPMLSVNSWAFHIFTALMQEISNEQLTPYPLLLSLSRVLLCRAVLTISL